MDPARTVPCRYFGPGSLLVKVDGKYRDVAAEALKLDVIALALQEDGNWPSHEGRVALVGDAGMFMAHPWQDSGYSLVVLNTDAAEQHIARWMGDRAMAAAKVERIG